MKWNGWKSIPQPVHNNDNGGDGDDDEEEHDNR